MSDERRNYLAGLPPPADWSVVTPDEIFGPYHQVLVRRFQQLLNLPNDGIVGPDTWTRPMQSATTTDRSASEPCRVYRCIEAHADERA